MPVRKAAACPQHPIPPAHSRFSKPLINSSVSSWKCKNAQIPFSSSITSRRSPQITSESGKGNCEIGRILHLKSEIGQSQVELSARLRVRFEISDFGI